MKELLVRREERRLPAQARQGSGNDDCGSGVPLRAGLAITETDATVFIAVKRTAGAAQARSARHPGRGSGRVSDAAVCRRSRGGREYKVVNGMLLGLERGLES